MASKYVVGAFAISSDRDRISETISSVTVNCPQLFKSFLIPDAVFLFASASVIASVAFEIWEKIFPPLISDVIRDTISDNRSSNPFFTASCSSSVIRDNRPLS